MVNVEPKAHMAWLNPFANPTKPVVPSPSPGTRHNNVGGPSIFSVQQQCLEFTHPAPATPRLVAKRARPRSPADSCSMRHPAAERRTRSKNQTGKATLICRWLTRRRHPCRPHLGSGLGRRLGSAPHPCPRARLVVPRRASLSPRRPAAVRWSAGCSSARRTWARRLTRAPGARAVDAPACSARVWHAPRPTRRPRSSRHGTASFGRRSLRPTRCARHSPTRLYSGCGCGFVGCSHRSQQAWCGRPALVQLKRLIGRGRPRLAAASGTLWRRKQPPGEPAGRGLCCRVSNVGARSGAARLPGMRPRMRCRAAG